MVKNIENCTNRTGLNLNCICKQNLIFKAIELIHAKALSAKFDVLAKSRPKWTA